MKSQEMYLIIFGVVILKLQISVSDPQFPRHIDLAKVGEAIFNNERFNILKPTAHLITDHFKDFMLRKGTANTGERIFIDKNGFRHAWSGFGDKTKSLRKTDLKHRAGSLENVPEKSPGSGNDSTVDNDDDNKSAAVTDTNEQENNNQEDNNASSDSKTVQDVAEEDTEPPDSLETTTISNISHNAYEMNTTEITIQQRVASNEKKEPIKKVEIRAGTDKTKQRTVATTTFFCPFLGVIKMSSFID